MSSCILPASQCAGPPSLLMVFRGPAKLPGSPTNKAPRLGPNRATSTLSGTLSTSHDSASKEGWTSSHIYSSYHLSVANPKHSQPLENLLVQRERDLPTLSWTPVTPPKKQHINEKSVKGATPPKPPHNFQHITISGSRLKQAGAQAQAQAQAHPLPHLACFLILFGLRSPSDLPRSWNKDFPYPSHLDPYYLIFLLPSLYVPIYERDNEQRTPILGFFLTMNIGSPSTNVMRYYYNSNKEIEPGSHPKNSQCVTTIMHLLSLPEAPSQGMEIPHP